MNISISQLTYNYVKYMAVSKPFNPQAMAINRMLRIKKESEILNILEMKIDDFLERYPLSKVKDFVYKTDYFTPRDMYLINPLYYLYYTKIVFEIFVPLANQYHEVNFSLQTTQIYYSGLLQYQNDEKIIKENADFGRSYFEFTNKRESFFNNSAIKLDISDFFNSIKIENLIYKLYKKIDRKNIIDDLDQFFRYTKFNTLPQLHYSIASSVLSQFYLMDFDDQFNVILKAEEMSLIRFVDDMFIISTSGDITVKKYNNMLNVISFLLWKDDLSLNTTKTSLLNSEEFEENFKLAARQYENKYVAELIIEEKVDNLINDDSLIILVKELCEIEEEKGIDLIEYKQVVNKYLSINNENTRKVINHIIFSNRWYNIPDESLVIIVSNWKFILFNPTQFTILYIKICRYLEGKKLIEGQNIKNVLNYLYRNDYLNYRDTLVIIAYLFQNKKPNTELMGKIRNVNSEYVDYMLKYIF